MMRKILARGAVAGAAVSAVLAGSALTAMPANAGGPGSVYVDGSTYTSCHSKLKRLMMAHEAAGGHITGADDCFYSVNRWHGGFVVNYD